MIPIINECTFSDRICHLHKFIRADHPDRINFVNKAVKWTIDSQKRAVSSKSDNSAHSKFLSKYGDFSLHKGLAMTFWNEKNYAESRQHFLFSDDGKSCGEMLVQFHLEQGFPTEVDLFIVQTVLQ